MAIGDVCPPTLVWRRPQCACVVSVARCGYPLAPQQMLVCVAPPHPFLPPCGASCHQFPRPAPLAPWGSGVSKGAGKGMGPGKGGFKGNGKGKGPGKGKGWGRGGGDRPVPSREERERYYKFWCEPCDKGFRNSTPPAVEAPKELCSGRHCSAALSVLYYTIFLCNSEFLLPYFFRRPNQFFPPAFL